MDQGKQVQAQLYNKNTKLWFNLIQIKISGHQQKLSSAKPTKADHIVSRLYAVGSIPGTGLIKPDLTEAGLPEPKPDSELRMARPTRTIRKLNTPLNKTTINSTDSLGHSLSHSKFSL